MDLTQAVEDGCSMARVLAGHVTNVNPIIGTASAEHTASLLLQLRSAVESLARLDHNWQLSQRAVELEREEHLSAPSVSERGEEEDATSTTTTAGVSDRLQRCDSMVECVNQRMQQLMEQHPWSPSADQRLGQFCAATGTCADASAEDKNNNSMGSTAGAEVVMWGSEEARVDPWTRQGISRPVRNRVCGHVYDYHSVVQVLERAGARKSRVGQRRKNGGVRCPQLGCRNEAPLDWDDLEESSQSLPSSS